MILRVQNLFFSVWMLALLASISFAFKSDNYLYAGDRIQVSHLYPNPATDFVDVDYQITAPVREVKIVFYNILGQEVKDVTLEKDQRSVRISLRDFNNGMYLYQLEIDGRSVVTKKLIVRKL
jgi:hypothetical protein